MENFAQNTIWRVCNYGKNKILRQPFGGRSRYDRAYQQFSPRLRISKRFARAAYLFVYGQRSAFIRAFDRRGRKTAGAGFALARFPRTQRGQPPRPFFDRRLYEPSARLRRLRHAKWLCRCDFTYFVRFLIFSFVLKGFSPFQAFSRLTNGFFLAIL